MSIISAQRLTECQGFVDKVSEIRFTKVRQRQLNKYNMLLNKKEGNITRAHAINLTNNLASQAGRQSDRQGHAYLPPREGSNPPSAGSQVGALLPSREGSNSPSAGSSSQVIAHLPPKEGSNPPLAGSQVGTPLPSGEGSNSPPAIAHLPSREGSNSPSAGSSSQAIAHLPSGKGSNSPLAIAQLPPSKGSSSTLAIAHLPPGEGSNSPSAGSSSQAIAHLPLGEGSNSTPAIAHLPSGEGGSSPQAGHSNNQTRPGRQGLRWSYRHRAPQASQENSTVSQEDNTSTTPSRLPQGSSNGEPNPKWVINLSNKPLTAAQRSVLAKGPNYVVTPRQPPNLKYITTIEAACTKLSQQDAEELRADINRVLRFSQPPNQT